MTSREVLLSTVLFGLLALAASIPLILLFRRELFQAGWRPVGLASAVFWAVFGMTMIFAFWEIYYRSFYPSWVRWLAPLNALLYAGFGVGMWWVSTRLPGPPALWFVLLGGVEGIAEHIFGIYVLRILEKVPILHGLSPFAVIVFSFFEYILYWALACWLAFGFAAWWA